MKIIDFKFERLPDSAQFCSNVAIYSFFEEESIEFKAYCMINSMAEPVDIAMEQIDDNHYKFHILTDCEMPAMSERCILVSGKLNCRQVNHQLHITCEQRIIE